VASSTPAIEETMGREIESRQGVGWEILNKRKNMAYRLQCCIFRCQWCLDFESLFNRRRPHLAIRATRLGAFSPIGKLFYFGYFI
jgi:hypothetical protein